MSEERTEKYYSKCMICPRNCGINRHLYKGYCGCNDTIKAARAGLHYYEEPFISGVNGSGTVFFTGCSLGCIYCQNTQISHDNFGLKITVERLASIFLEQQERNAHNINIVTGTHFTPSIAAALKMARENGLYIPVVWNSSGYEKPEILKLLDGLVDIFMPDFKTLSQELGFRYFNAPDYADRAEKVLACMVHMTGKAVFEPLQQDGARHTECTCAECGQDDDSSELFPGEGVLMKRGVVVRHLVIPGQTEDSMNVLRYLYDTYGNDIWISLLNQYTPVGRFVQTDISGGRMHSEKPSVWQNCYLDETDPGNRKNSDGEKYPELFRTVSAEEYDKVVDLAIDLGIENCMIQDQETADDSFIPVFDGTGILRKD